MHGINQYRVNVNTPTTSPLLTNLQVLPDRSAEDHAERRAALHPLLQAEPRQQARLRRRVHARPTEVHRRAQHRHFQAGGLHLQVRQGT